MNVSKIIYLQLQTQILTEESQDMRVEHGQAVKNPTCVLIGERIGCCSSVV